MDQIRNIARPVDVPDHGLLCDLLWSDPDKEIEGWGENDRGVSYTFGADKVAEFLQKHDLDLVCRAHQVFILILTCCDTPFLQVISVLCVSCDSSVNVIPIANII